jgi:hypothetical protein
MHCSQHICHFFNASWKSCSVGVLSTSITSIVSKLQSFNFIFNQGNREMWGGWGMILCFGQKFSGEKGSVRWCFVIMKESLLLSPMFRAKSFHIFTQSLQKITVVCGIDCLMNSLWTIHDEHVLHFALHLSLAFIVMANLDFLCTTHVFFPEWLSDHC